VSRPVVFTGDIFRLQVRGGITRYFAEVVPRLQRSRVVVLGFHVSAECDALGDRARPAYRIPRQGVWRRVVAPLNHAFESAAFRRWPDAILHPTYYRSPASLPSGHPLVVTVHDMAHERFPQWFPERRRWWSRRDAATHKAALCARADRVLCNSEATRADAVSMLGLRPGITRVVHHAGRDWTLVPPRPIAGLDRPFLLWVGERGGYKNFELSARAWASCPEACDTGLLCVGGGPLTQSEREALSGSGALGRVRQLDADDGELRWAYEHAAALLYTALWEGFGLPILEALSLGCPVIASDRPAAREVGGDAPHYAEPGDLDSLRSAVRRCLAEGRDGPRASAGRALASRFTWDACAAGVEAVYRELD
jgi:glycosyltransferase involved in cell wall biosynthesis